VIEAASVAEAAANSHVVTLVTRARQPFFAADMTSPGTHVNAVGAVTPERQEFFSDLLARADWIATDEPAAARKLSREFIDYYAKSPELWEDVQPLSQIVAQAQVRSQRCDLSVFKAMGMGVADVALGAEILHEVLAAGRGRRLARPVRVKPRLRP
jgi:ornithine cyclodeaminase